MPIGCDPSVPAPLGVAGTPRSNDDGSVIAFDQCDADSRCRPMYWTATEGARAFTLTGGGIMAGMSDDGQLVLVSPQVSLSPESLLYSPDGTSVPSGIGPTPALLSPDGDAIGVSPLSSNAFNLLRRRAAVPSNRSASCRSPATTSCSPALRRMRPSSSASRVHEPSATRRARGS